MLSRVCRPEGDVSCAQSSGPEFPQLVMGMEGARVTRETMEEVLGGQSPSQRSFTLSEEQEPGRWPGQGKSI